MHATNNMARHRRVGMASILAIMTFLAFSVADMITPFDVLAFAEDERLLQEARARIQVVRRGTIMLNFTPADAGKTVEIRQLSHAFRFGANAFKYNRTYNPDSTFNVTLNETYTSHFKALFNYATLPFYMKGYNEFLAPEFLANLRTTLHEMVAMLRAAGIDVKGHPLIWQIPGQLPDQLELSDNATYREEVALRHIENVLLNHADITTWDLVNEMTHVQNILLGSTAIETWEKALAKARSVRTDCEFIANEYETIQPGDASTSDNDAGRFFDFVEQVVADGFAPDAIGFQGHEWMSAWVPMKDIIETFDSFGRFKIPIHVTEFDPGSQRYYGGARTIRRGQMTGETQAELATKAYTMFFSHPACEAITWWSFIEDPWWRPELGDYLMDADGRLLPAYEALFDLIHVQWNSTSTLTLDSLGTCDFTGFYGNYTATIGTAAPIPFTLVDTRPAASKPWTTTDIHG
jgi:endo-1,4-beta-xylanase